METITRGEFDSLGDEALIDACIGKTVRRVMGKSLVDKIRITGGLTEGQRALLMFRMMQGHSMDGAAALFQQLSYLLAHSGVWLEFKKGLKYFGDKALSRLAERLEVVYGMMTMGSDGWTVSNVGPGLKTALEKLDRDLAQGMPGFVRAVAARIRLKPGEFISIIE